MYIHLGTISQRDGRTDKRADGIAKQYRALQWRNILTGGPWKNYIKGPIPHFEFTEEFITIKVLTKITIKHKTMMTCEVKSNFIIKAKLSV